MEIPLSRGLVALVDDEDYSSLIGAGSWYAHQDESTFYARRNYWTTDASGARVCRSMRMHALILGCPLVDHINGDGLDNRRANLRPATSAQNSQNRQRRSDNRTGFKGVARSYGSRFKASIWVDGRRRALGGFASADEAARAYDLAAIRHFGQFARTNFPREDYAA